MSLFEKDTERFQTACELILSGNYYQNGIGSLGEKTLHAVLKNYFEPHEISQEIKVGSHVADIVGQDGIIEIQTRNFHSLKKKLEKLLSVTDVTVVYPVAAKKDLVWVNADTGEAELSKRGGKKDSGLSIFYELVHILPFINDARLHFCLMFLHVEEVRQVTAGNKRRSQRLERYPKALLDQQYFETTADFVRLLPVTSPFTVKELQKAGNISPRLAQSTINVLMRVGALTREKKGRSFYYSIAE